MISTKVVKRDYDIDKIKEGKVRVGWWANSKYSGNLTVPQVARWNEFGTPRVPARPFVRPAIHRNEQDLRERLRHQYQDALRNNKDSMVVLERFGVYVKGLIQDEIVSGHHRPNRPSTIKKKGFNAPLRDTLLMLNSITYETEEVMGK